LPTPILSDGVTALVGLLEPNPENKSANWKRIRHMNSDLDQPLKGVKLAVTVDDLFEWLGTRRFEKYSYLDVAKSFTNAFSNHGLRDVWFQQHCSRCPGRRLEEGIRPLADSRSACGQPHPPPRLGRLDVTG
jgi:hypothetical protein